nr:hypothetical protein [Tanacetum cinerariifolium]
MADLVHDYSNDSVIDHDEEVVHKEVTGEVIEFTPQISLNALNGVESFQTLRVTGHVGKHDLHILIDTRSTYNFLDVNKAKKLGCHFSNTCPLKVDIPGGAQLTSKNMCKKFSWKIHGEEFVVDAMLLPLGGCDMGRKVALRGTRKSCLQWMEGSKDMAQPAQLSSMVLCVYPSTSLNIVSTNLTEGNPTSIASLLTHFHDVFAIPTSLPPIREYDHKIVLKKGTEPIFSRPYRHHPAQNDAIEIMDGTWRMCIDYKKLNAQTIKDKFPILIIEELIDELQVFKKYLRKFVLVFFDDILVYSPDLSTHVKYLELVLLLLRRHTLFAKQSKCVFGSTRVEYFGHATTGVGVATDDTKIEAMKHWPIPSNLKQLRGFLGLTGYYRKFIKG